MNATRPKLEKIRQPSSSSSSSSSCSSLDSPSSASSGYGSCAEDDVISTSPTSLGKELKYTKDADFLFVDRLDVGEVAAVTSSTNNFVSGSVEFASGDSDFGEETDIFSLDKLQGDLGCADNPWITKISNSKLSDGSPDSRYVSSIADKKPPATTQSVDFFTEYFPDYLTDYTDVKTSDLLITSLSNQVNGLSQQPQQRPQQQFQKEQQQQFQQQFQQQQQQQPQPQEGTLSQLISLDSHEAHKKSSTSTPNPGLPVHNEYELLENFNQNINTFSDFDDIDDMFNVVFLKNGDEPVNNNSKDITSSSDFKENLFQPLQYICDTDENNRINYNYDSLIDSEFLGSEYLKTQSKQPDNSEDDEFQMKDFKICLKRKHDSNPHHHHRYEDTPRKQAKLDESLDGVTIIDADDYTVSDNCGYTESNVNEDLSLDENSKSYALTNDTFLSNFTFQVSKSNDNSDEFANSISYDPPSSDDSKLFLESSLDVGEIFSNLQCHDVQVDLPQESGLFYTSPNEINILNSNSVNNSNSSSNSSNHSSNNHSSNSNNAINNLNPNFLPQLMKTNVQTDGGCYYYIIALQAPGNNNNNNSNGDNINHNLTPSNNININSNSNSNSSSNIGEIINFNNIIGSSSSNSSSNSSNNNNGNNSANFILINTMRNIKQEDSQETAMLKNNNNNNNNNNAYNVNNNNNNNTDNTNNKNNNPSNQHPPLHSSNQRARHHAETKAKVLQTILTCSSSRINPNQGSDMIYEKLLNEATVATTTTATAPATTSASPSNPACSNQRNDITDPKGEVNRRGVQGNILHRLLKGQLDDSCDQKYSYLNGNSKNSINSSIKSNNNTSNNNNNCIKTNNNSSNNNNSKSNNGSNNCSKNSLGSNKINNTFSSLYNNMISNNNYSKNNTVTVSAKKNLR